MKLNNLTKSASLATLLLLASCATPPPLEEYQTEQQSHQFEDISHLDEREKADLYEAIIAADLASANQQFEVATSYYLSAARMSKSINLIELAIDAADQSNDNLAKLQAAELWLSIEPHNIDAHVTAIRAMLSHQDIDQAVASTQKLFKLEKNQGELALLLDEMVEAKSPPIANAYFSQLDANNPDNIAVLYARGAFFARVAKLTPRPSEIMKQAFAELAKARKIKPDFIPAIDLTTRLLYQSRQDEKAEAFLRKLHGEYPKSAEISHMLGQLLYDLRKFDLAKQHYNNWLKTNKKDSKAYFYLASSYFATNDYQRSLKNFQKILGKDYKPQLTYFFCGSSAAQSKQYAQAIACYNLVTEGKYLTRSKIELAKLYALKGEVDKALATVRNPKFAETRESEIQLINIEVEILKQYKGDIQALVRLEGAITSHPQAISLLFKKFRMLELTNKPEQLMTQLNSARANFEQQNKRHQFDLAAAALLKNNQHYQQAVDWLTEVLKEKPQDRDYLYARALYKEPLGLHDEMIADFKHLLAIDPENTNIMNALGYTLVDVNQELDYAAELIEKAYLAMPDNAAVVDSKGWLAFRKGEYREALQFLNLAYKMSPSADVATHIGEVHWATGQQEKAMAFWNKAQQLEPNNYLLFTTIKRLGVTLEKKNTAENAVQEDNKQ
jgi:tetratricopeptide (TPR) repeat protein